LKTGENGVIRTERKERPRLISELLPDIAKLIEDVTADSKGAFDTKTLQQVAGEQGAAGDAQYRQAVASDVTRLSDAELRKRARVGTHRRYFSFSPHDRTPFLCMLPCC